MDYNLIDERFGVEDSELFRAFILAQIYLLS